MTCASLVATVVLVFLHLEGAENSNLRFCMSGDTLSEENFHETTHSMIEYIDSVLTLLFIDLIFEDQVDTRYHRRLSLCMLTPSCRRFVF